jgi:hypothetical protein
LKGHEEVEENIWVAKRKKNKEAKERKRAKEEKTRGRETGTVAASSPV